jgi:putative restriction endonuclease
MLTRDEFLSRLRTIRTWRRGDQRAPNKPLLFLYALGRLASGAPQEVRYDVVDEELGSLLTDFGPPRSSVHPEYPFWRLQRDQLWVVQDSDGLPRRHSNSDPTRGALLEHGTRGGFPADVQALLEADLDLRRVAALELLTEHFPASIHEELLAAVGLPSEWALEGPTPSSRRTRRAGFRAEVLQAYGHACAICGFDARLKHRTIGLDAAHIRWHVADGPDEVSNGLALCALHHRALDLGVLGLDEDLRVLVSGQASGAWGFEEAFLRHLGQKLRPPHSAELRPDSAHTAWHRREVFHGPSRTG